MANINKIKLSGTTYNIEDKNAPKTVELTQAEYDALVSAGTVDPNTFYIITDASAIDMTQYYTSAQTESAITAAVSGKADTSAVTTVNNALSTHTANTNIHVTAANKTTWNGKQDALVSGTNIKTINNESLLGSGNITIQGGGGSASSAITSGDTNPVQGGVLFDELRIPITGEVETLLEWDNHDEGETTNYPLGCSKIKIYVDESQGETNGFQFWETDWESVGGINITYNNGNVTVNDYSNVTYTIDGNVVTVNYPSIAADVTKIYSVYDNYWTVKAYTSGIVYEPLIDKFDEVEQVTARALIDLNDKFGGLKLVKISQTDYDNIQVKDTNTLYIITQ